VLHRLPHLPLQRRLLARLRRLVAEEVAVVAVDVEPMAPQRLHLRVAHLLLQPAVRLLTQAAAGAADVVVEMPAELPHQQRRHRQQPPRRRRRRRQPVAVQRHQPRRRHLTHT
jgi:hypothetical protein